MSNHEMTQQRRRRRRRRQHQQEQSCMNIKDASVNHQTSKDTNDKLTKESRTSSSSLAAASLAPFLLGLLVLGIPYGFHAGYCWFVLQHPMTNMGMRHAVRNLQDPRQVLILGSMSSGTSSIADTLKHEFHMEIGHEDADAQWKFVRDGTVSWFHGIRYWPTTNKNNNNSKTKNETISKLCTISWFITSHRENDYGFGPALFGTPDYNCSFLHPRFHECYHHACTKALQREYGCALEEEWEEQPGGSTTTTTTSSCQPPFQKTLLQTREPWKIITSLVAKYCWHNNEILENSPNSLRWLLQALDLITNKTDPCPTQMMDYVVRYYNTILDNAPVSSAAFQIYPIETSTPCQVAQMAGLDDVRTTIYTPHHHTFQKTCRPAATAAAADDDGVGHRPSSLTTTTSAIKSTMPIHKQSNVINRGRISITNVLPYATPEHLKRISALYERLGYVYDDHDW